MEKWDPLRDIFSLRERVNKLFEDAPLGDGRVDSAAWVPAIDVYETPVEFIVRAELPGVREPDISIRIEDNTLRMIGKRKSYREGRSYHQVERCYGYFSRSFALPAVVDKDTVKATLKDGILEITLSRKNEGPPKYIEIK